MLQNLGVDESSMALLQPHQLAVLVLRMFRQSRNNEWMRGNLTNRYSYMPPQGTATDAEQTVHLLMEGFHWLDRNNYIMPCPGNEKRDTWTLTRKGREASLDLETVPASDFPAHLLHPLVEAEAYALLIQAKFDLAVAAAFRRIELRVRDMAGLGDDKIGRRLMQQAFSANDGALAIKRDSGSEQIAEMELFTGAIGYYRNPAMHREVHRDAQGVYQALLFASQLMTILDQREEDLGG